MNGGNVQMFALVVVSFLTWLVFVITACKFYKFFNLFENYKSKNDVELNSLVWHAKKLDGSLTEIIAELRRANKLLYEIDTGRDGQLEPAAEPEFKIEDILRHNKFDFNKTPTAVALEHARSAGAEAAPLPAEHAPAVSGICEHKTAPGIADLQRCLDNLAKITPQTEKLAAEGERPIRINQAVPAGGAVHKHMPAANAEPAAQLRKAPPPDDLSGRLSIEELNIKTNVDLRHLTETPGAVCVKK